VPLFRNCAADQPRIVTEKIGNKKNVALRAVSLIIIKDLAKRVKILRAEEKMATNAFSALSAFSALLALWFSELLNLT
jgi:hypothetical protein